MPEAWLQIECPACGEHWEGQPTELPGSHESFSCPHCNGQRSTAEFMRTQRDLELLKQFS